MMNRSKMIKRKIAYSVVAAAAMFCVTAMCGVDVKAEEAAPVAEEAAAEETPAEEAPAAE